MIRRIDWQDTISIRHSVLWPDKPEEFCHITGDEEADHYGFFVDQELVCVASIYIHHSHARLRKFATLPDYQRQGIGKKMLAYMIDHYRGLLMRSFWCDARSDAIGFYESFGMNIEGDLFYKSDQAYYRMRLYYD